MKSCTASRAPATAHVRGVVACDDLTTPSLHSRAANVKLSSHIEDMHEQV